MRGHPLRGHPRLFIPVIGSCLAMFAALPASAQSYTNDPTSGVMSDIEQHRLYESFFRQFVSAPSTSGFVEVRLNGDQRIQTYQPSVQESTGLTDAESNLVRETASKYIDRIDALHRAAAGLRREALFQKIESGRILPNLESRLQGVQTEKMRLFSETLESLKNNLGASRFLHLNEYIRSKRTEREFFPRSAFSATPTPR